MRKPVKTLQIELPDRLAQEVDALVKAGWFSHQAEVVRLALWEFVRRHRLALLEQFQREDIARAVQRKRPTL
jgi:Arc/MetJ-type ribon-helix-helix transcriptional regulator